MCQGAGMSVVDLREQIKANAAVLFSSQAETYQDKQHAQNPTRHVPASEAFEVAVAKTLSASGNEMAYQGYVSLQAGLVIVQGGLEKTVLQALESLLDATGMSVSCDLEAAMNLTSSSGSWKSWDATKVREYL
ncbi:hypothetical protein LTS10_008548 [Elasticomyces elasticus]|nr:hypothetical protein LTS10_008548 [Elasticomyces elasticus]